jgi:hypothetical protein
MQVAERAPAVDQVAEPPDLLLRLDQAVGAHRKWRDAFKKAMVAGETLDAKALQRNACCDLGKWLQSYGRTLYGRKPEFAKLIARHDSFHLSASTVAQAVNEQEYLAVDKMLNEGSQFAQASMDVEVAIMRLEFSLSN